MNRLFVTLLVAAICCPLAAAQSERRADVVYGTDDRLDYFQETDPLRRGWADSVAAMVSATDLQSGPLGIALSTTPYTISGRSPCAGEPFASQPTAAFCSGFLVGDDILATAGHCISSATLSSYRFVFGFRMEDADTAVTAFSPDQVYTPVELLGRELDGDGADYSIVRLDRPVTVAPPLAIRRSGAIGNGTPVGVIGYPSGLPLKIAFGATTAVRDASPAAFFVANLDTYGGNSGSPVFNPATGEVEGILVRGETDFVFSGDCFSSNRVTDANGRGEDVTKASAFAALVPELATGTGQVVFVQSSVGCAGEITLQLRDADLAAESSQEVLVISSTGESERVTLEATGAGRFRGVLPTSLSATAPADGRLQAASGGSLTARYDDAADSGGAPAVSEATVPVDCEGPTITGVEIPFAGAGDAIVTFVTSEPASGRVGWGATCGAISAYAEDASATQHAVLLTGLTPDTVYRFVVEAVDAAGNRGVDIHGGGCYTLRTAARVDSLTEQFAALPDLAGLSLSFTPDDSAAGYGLCAAPAPAPSLSGGTAVAFGDDDSLLLSLEDRTFTFFGNAYSGIYFSANGYFTFGQPDNTYSDTLANHFALPRAAFFFDDLNPGKAGAISWKLDSDRIAVFFEGVAEFDSGGGTVTVLAELFFDGRIRFTYGGITIDDATVGLSRGLGVPAYYANMDLSAGAACESSEGESEGAPEGNAEGNAEGSTEGEGGCTADTQRARDHAADNDSNGRIGLSELLRVIQFFNRGQFACSPGAVDGYAPGTGDTSCARHDSDYQDPAWSIGLGELVRLVQFFASAGYTTSPCTSDGFTPLLLP